jgi:hypothetical protein
MPLSSHELSILRDYMDDLVVQARQEAMEPSSQRYAAARYTADQALLDLLALLDDRIESEGAQLGLSGEFPHRLWALYDQARTAVGDDLWLRASFDETPWPKARVREAAYRGFLEYLGGALGEAG